MSTPDRRARAGKAVRDLGHALVGHDVGDDLLDRVATDLETLTELLVAGAPRSRGTDDPARRNGFEAPPDGGIFESHHDRPVSGRSSPWGLDAVIRRVGDDVEAVVTLRSAHEGAPGRSHGGVVSALFDDVFGFLLSIVGTPAFTGELAIRYERSTPLHVPLTCHVRIVEREGRKMHMTGELTDPDGQVCARATATFITIDPARVPGWGDGV